MRLAFILILFRSTMFVKCQENAKDLELREAIEKGSLCYYGNGVCIPYHLCQNGLNATTTLDPAEECSDIYDQCCAVKKNAVTTAATKEKHECGFRNLEGVGFRIINHKDNEANYGEFPWMVAISVAIVADDKVLNLYLCGGSLIHPSIVLTVAHRLHEKNPSSLIVRAGDWDTSSENEMFSHSEHNVEEIEIHNNFTISSLQNDIALVFLKTPAELGDHISTICLPPQGLNFDNRRCVASGWGKNLSGKEGRYQEILKKVELPVLTKDSCEKGLRNTKLGKHFKLHDSFICAGGEAGVDTCYGDGGSALVCENIKNPGYYYQAGIVAWGIGCGQSGVPGVYVNVAQFRNWIDTQIKKRNFGAEYYKWEKPNFD